MIQVDANLFRLAYYAVSTEETRYYLNGVHIEAHPEKGALLVSTDGHRMVVIHDEDGICEEACIVQFPKYALALCKQINKLAQGRVLEIDLDEKTATISDVFEGGEAVDGLTLKPVTTVHGDIIIDGTFTEWQRVVPQKPSEPVSAAPTAFGSQFLKDWGVFGRDIEKTCGMGGGLQVALSDGGSPVVLRWGSANHIFAVQMPMRSAVEGFLPEFMSTVQAAHVPGQAAE